MRAACRRPDRPLSCGGKLLAAGAGERLHVLDDVATFKAAATDLQGALSIVEIRSSPGRGAALHVHAAQDEVLYVLEGAYRVCLGTTVAVLHAGGSAVVPRGTRHGYTNVGDGRARLLLVATPGRARDEIFAEMATGCIADPGVPELAAVLAALAAHRGITLDVER
jgi:quercetin dioxygenase-like cupin family protein